MIELEKKKYCGIIYLFIKKKEEGILYFSLQFAIKCGVYDFIYIYSTTKTHIQNSINNFFGGYYRCRRRLCHLILQ